jgi:hypothetical protein
MVEEKTTCHLCGECPEMAGDIIAGFGFCYFLHQRVWANSVMCPHGEDLLECF